MYKRQYLGNDEVNGVSLNGQYITLAARESIVTESPVTFNLNSLPSDAMSNYTDFLVVAVPVTSGKGDMKYRWDATAEEVSAAIASHANETKDTNKEIWWKNGYEIVRTGEHSYTCLLYTSRLLAAKPADVTLAALLPKIDKSTGVLTDSTDAQTADGEVILANFQNKLNLQADIYVGGIVGANDADTKLTIQNATNGATQNALSVGGLNPSNGAFKDGVLLNALAGGRYDFDTPRGALAGGIIGYATPNTKLESCTNYGTVAHKCAAGGFAGWNEGTITDGSMAASLGNRETGYTYLGGVAGVNGGLIQSAYPLSLIHI